MYMSGESLLGHINGGYHCGMAGRPNHARHRVWDCRRSPHWNRGRFIGSWLLPQLGIHLGLGICCGVINATIGALILLLIIRLVRGGRRVAKVLGRRWVSRSLGAPHGLGAIRDARSRRLHIQIVDADVAYEFRIQATARSRCKTHSKSVISTRFTCHYQVSSEVLCGRYILSLG